MLCFYWWEQATYTMNSENRAFKAPDAVDAALQNYRIGCFSSAENICRRILEAQPDNPEALHLLGVIAHQSGDQEVALELMEKAIRLQPSNADYRCNLGEVYRVLNKLDAAENCLRTAVALQPHHAQAHVNLGYVLRELGRLDEAEASYQQALRCNPAFAHAKLNYALLELLRGNYARGFELFESRFEAGDDRAIAHDRALLESFDVPRWQGHPIPGKTLLLWTEQGLGDNLMMMRYLPLLRERGVQNLLIYCHDPLFRLMQTVDGVDEVISRDEPLPAGTYHFHCPMMSLPLLFRTRLDTIPNETPYLRVPDWLSDKWRRRLCHLARPRVGLAWASGKLMRAAGDKSIHLAQFASLFELKEISFVSLQKGEEANQLTDSGWKIFDCMDACEDLLDTAALVEQLDLVISVDTAVVHLAGALGRPVWLLNRFVSDWRWMLDREDSPWYPTMRIFRQSWKGRWDSVIEKVALELHGRFASAPRSGAMPVPRGAFAESTPAWRRWVLRLRR